MKAGELFVEPVLIGFGVLLTVAMMGFPKLEEWLLKTEWGQLALAAGAAYFSGIVFDRVADTILGRLEHLHRLRFATSELARGSVKLQRDPFPEDQYHIALMGPDQAWEHAYYLRSRIRLTRAMLVLIPALGVAAAIRAADEPYWVYCVAVSLVVLTYSFAIFVRTRELVPVIREELISNPSGCFGLPRTNGLTSREVAEWLKRTTGKPSPLAAYIIRNEPLAWGAVVLAAVSAFAGEPGQVIAEFRN